MKGIALFVWLQILEFHQALYHVIELMPMMLCPVELGAFVC